MATLSVLLLVALGCSSGQTTSSSAASSSSGSGSASASSAESSSVSSGTQQVESPLFGTYQLIAMGIDDKQEDTKGGTEVGGTLVADASGFSVDTEFEGTKIHAEGTFHQMASDGACLYSVDTLEGFSESKLGGRTFSVAALLPNSEGTSPSQIALTDSFKDSTVNLYFFLQ